MPVAGVSRARRAEKSPAPLALEPRRVSKQVSGQSGKSPESLRKVSAGKGRADSQPQCQEKRHHSDKAIILHEIQGLRVRRPGMKRKLGPGQNGKE